MIKVYDDKQVVITFGSGDIFVGGGDNLQSKIGIVVLQNQEATPIGKHPTRKPGETIQHKDVDCLIQFTKIESIDVVISALQDAKRCMLKNVED